MQPATAIYCLKDHCRICHPTKNLFHHVVPCTKSSVVGPMQGTSCRLSLGGTEANRPMLAERKTTCQCSQGACTWGSGECQGCKDLLDEVCDHVSPMAKDVQKAPLLGAWCVFAACTWHITQLIDDWDHDLHQHKSGHGSCHVCEHVRLPSPPWQRYGASLPSGACPYMQG